MFDRERLVYRATLDLVERLIDDVTNDELSKHPLPGMNPPRWILGHLAVSTDSGLRVLRQEPALSPEWRQAFGPGSENDVENGLRPTKDVLLTALRGGHERVLAALDDADEAVLAQPHGITFASLDRGFPTRGDLLAFLMGGHEAFHIGQLSAWRRASGRSPLF
ncbi:MAG: DinB family protein [Planctomycetaceae bacterium]